MKYLALLLILAGAGGAVPAPAPAATSCTPTVFRPDGVPAQTRGKTGPGLVLSGSGAGTMPDAALTFMRRMAGGPSGRSGNVVILRASDGRENTDRFYKTGQFGFVQEILIPPCAQRGQVDALASRLGQTDSVYFAGGDQSNYTRWKDSRLMQAVRSVYARAGVVGGGSAGLAIQGSVVYDSAAADRLHPGDDNFEVGTKDAVRTPLEPEISFTTHLFAWPPLRNTLTDTHFAQRNRFGRTVAFMALILRKKLGTAPFYALAVDAGSVVLAGSDGMATLRTSPKSKGAYLLRLVAPVALRPGEPLHASVTVLHFDRDGQRFDLLRKTGAVQPYTVTVDGSKVNPYSRNPYE